MSPNLTPLPERGSSACSKSISSSSNILASSKPLNSSDSISFLPESIPAANSLPCSCSLSLCPNSGLPGSPISTPPITTVVSGLCPSAACISPCSGKQIGQSQFPHPHSLIAGTSSASSLPSIDKASSTADIHFENSSR